MNLIINKWWVQHIFVQFLHLACTKGSDDFRTTKQPDRSNGDVNPYSFPHWSSASGWIHRNNSWMVASLVIWPVHLISSRLPEDPPHTSLCLSFLYQKQGRTTLLRVALVEYEDGDGQRWRDGQNGETDTRNEGPDMQRQVEDVQQLGKETILWESRNSTDGLFSAVSVNFTVKAPFQVKFTGGKHNWNDVLIVAQLVILNSTCPSQTLTTTSLLSSTTTEDMSSFGVKSSTDTSTSTASTTEKTSTGEPDLLKSTTKTNTRVSSQPAQMTTKITSFSTETTRPSTSFSPSTHASPTLSTLTSSKATEPTTQYFGHSTLLSTAPVLPTSEGKATTLSLVLASIRTTSVRSGAVVGVVVVVVFLLSGVVVGATLVYRRGYYNVCCSYLRFENEDDEQSLSVSFYNNSGDEGAGQFHPDHPPSESHQASELSSESRQSKTTNHMLTDQTRLQPHVLDSPGFHCATSEEHNQAMAADDVYRAGYDQDDLENQSSQQRKNASEA